MQTLSMRSLMPSGLGLLAFALAQLLAFAPAVSAQSEPPPTYDYDAFTPGTQPPQSPLLDGYTYRSVRTYQVAIPVIVPLAELQAVLPPGFAAIATPAGSTTATVTLNLFLDQRFQPVVGGPTYGPTTALLITVTALNNNLATPRLEIVFPGFEASADIDQLNAAFGAGAARLAKVEAEIKEGKGRLHFSFELSDPGIGFKLRAEAEGPAAINNRAISDPVGLPFRTLSGFTPNQAFRAASQSDTLSIPSSSAGVKLLAPGNNLQLQTGKLAILGLGANVTFSRNVEFMLKFE
ncbi:MAG: hypothetical protein ACOYMG_23180 [Candidatus Methylumidiphilus sp.]